jgi:hypothetical protein
MSRQDPRGAAMPTAAYRSRSASTAPSLSTTRAARSLINLLLRTPLYAPGHDAPTANPHASCPNPHLHAQSPRKPTQPALSPCLPAGRQPRTSLHPTIHGATHPRYPVTNSQTT